MTTSSKGIYSETLQSIIDAKLEELVKKRDVFELRKSEVLQECNAELDDVRKLSILLEGLKRCFQIKQNSNGDLVSSGTARHGLFELLLNLGKFLEQPRYDASISKALLAEWQSTLLHELDAQSARYEYASLYARLVTDWLSSEQGLSQPTADGDQEMSDDFVELESAAKLDSRREWENIVFSPFERPIEDLQAFLSSLFGERDETKEKLSKALETLRSSVGSFEVELLSPGQFNGHVIRSCIDGLVASNRLDNSKLQVLKNFQSNEIILSELADVLNLRLANLDGWNWGETVPVEQRRRLAGHYSNEMNEDLLQAIFLQYIGTKWAVFFRQKLATFVGTEGAWISANPVNSPIDIQRRRYYLGTEATANSLRAERHRVWRSQYLLAQLPRTEQQKILWSDGDEEADYGLEKKKKKLAARTSVGGKAPRMQLASRPDAGYRKRQRQSAHDESADDEDMGFGVYADESEEDYGDHSSAPQNLMGLKQRLLHLLQAEILINNRLYGQSVAFRGQFQKWDLMLPHSTIMAVLSFFGVSPQWRKFFTSFLEAPLKFSQGGTAEAPRKRQRGVPEHHPLSDALGEAVLFCMDLLINQKCNGSKLWRVHDDFWFWSSDSQVADRAWGAINEFSKLFGTPLDNDKVGSVRTGKAAQHKGRSGLPLPEDPIRWGFLYLNPESGEFDIDQSMVDSHVEELKHQLREKSSKGVISWIQAWNAYAITFFSTNFGKPAYCFGNNHMKKILSTLDRMQKKVFDGSNMIQYMTNTVKERYHVTDIPDGYVYFPTQIGGLDLRNPFITPLQFDKSLQENDPLKKLDLWQKEERESYESKERYFDKLVAEGKLSAVGVWNRNDYTPKGHEKYTFFSFEEYTKYREDYTYDAISPENRLGAVFRSLLDEPKAEKINLSHDIRQAVSSSLVFPLLSGGEIPGASSAYWLWVFQVYGPEVLKKFGGLNIVDPGVLPTGMVGLLKGDRVEWK